MSFGLSLNLPTLGAYNGFIRRLNPLQIYGDKLKIWLDPSDLSTLFQDPDGLVPVTADGDAVGLFLDKSLYGNHAYQPVPSRRPKYRTNGWLHWLEFDGVDDYLTAQAISAFESTEFIVANAAMSNSVNTISPIISTSESIDLTEYGLVQWLDRRSTPRRHSYISPDSLNLSLQLDDSIYVLMTTSNVTLKQALINGQLNDSANIASTGQNTTFTIGRTSYGPLHFSGNIYSTIVTSTNNSIDLLNRYLAKKSGVIL